MQTREQVKNWKVVGSLATVAALGISGLAVASTGDEAETPPPIEIDDRRSLEDVGLPPTIQPDFEIVPAPSVTMDESLDSPLASADDSPDDSPEPAPAPVVDDSPDDSPADSPDPAPAPAADDSPDDSPDASVDSGDSMDSLDS